MRLRLALALSLLASTALAGQPVTPVDATNTYQQKIDSSGAHVVLDSGGTGGSVTISAPLGTQTSAASVATYDPFVVSAINAAACAAPCQVTPTLSPFAATGGAVPANADYIGGNKSGNLTGALIDASGLLEADVDGFVDGTGCNGSVSSGIALCTITNTVGSTYAEVFMTSVGTSNIIAAQGSWDGGTTWYALAIQELSGTGSFSPNFAGDLLVNRGYTTFAVAPQMRLMVSTYSAGTVTGYMVLKRGAPPTMITATIYGSGNASTNTAGNGIKVGGVYRATPSVYTNGQQADLDVGTGGEVLVNISGAATTNQWQASVSLTDTTNTALHASCGAGLSNFLDGIEASGITTTTAVTLKVNDNVTAVATFNMSGLTEEVNYPEFKTSLKGTAATAMNAQLSGSPTGAIQVNAQGHCAAP